MYVDELTALFQSQHTVTALSLLSALVLLFVAKRLILVRLTEKPVLRKAVWAAFIAY